MIRAAPPGSPAHDVALFEHHEPPRATIGIIRKAVVLVERYMLLYGRSLIRAPRRVAPVLREDALKSAAFLNGAGRPDARRIEVKDVVLDRHILGLPPARAVVGWAGDIVPVTRLQLHDRR